MTNVETGTLHTTISVVGAGDSGKTNLIKKLGDDLILLKRIPNNGGLTLLLGLDTPGHTIQLQEFDTVEDYTGDAYIVAFNILCLESFKYSVEIIRKIKESNKNIPIAWVGTRVDISPHFDTFLLKSILAEYRDVKFHATTLDGCKINLVSFLVK